MTKSRGSSAQGQRAVAKGNATKRPTKSTKPLKIVFSDIPEMSEAQLAGMGRVGRPPVGELPRKAVSIRLDQRVLAWVKRRVAAQDQPYQSLINEILERAMRRAG